MHPINLKITLNFCLLKEKKRKIEIKKVKEGISEKEGLYTYYYLYYLYFNFIIIIIIKIIILSKIKQAIFGPCQIGWII